MHRIYFYFEFITRKQSSIKFIECHLDRGVQNMIHFTDSAMNIISFVMHLVAFDVNFTSRRVRLCLASRCRAFDISHL